MEPRLRRQDPSVSHLFNSDGTAIYDTKWHKEATQQVLSQNHNFGFSGGNESTKYSITLGLRDEKGFLLESTLKRYSARFNIEDQIKPWLKIGGTLDFNNQTSNPQDTRDAVPRQIVEDFQQFVLEQHLLMLYQDKLLKIFHLCLLDMKPVQELVNMETIETTHMQREHKTL